MDLYSDPIRGELIGRFRTMADVRIAAQQRDQETVGEWTPLLKKNGMVILDWRF